MPEADAVETMEKIFLENKYMENPSFDDISLVKFIHQ